MKTQSQKKKIYVFIDSQNLHLGIKYNVIKAGKLLHEGWNLDFKKFRTFLQDAYKATKVFLFIGYIKSNESLYSFLSKAGYTLVFKPTVEYSNHSKIETKGNVDAELVLHCAAIELNNYDKAIAVSGDGDFHCLYEFLIRKHKLGKILIPNKYSFSSLLREFNNYIDFVSTKRHKLERKEKGEHSLRGRTKKVAHHRD